MTASRNSQRGLSLIEVCLVIATVALVGLFFLPRLIRPRPRCVLKITCVNNLKQIGIAYRLYAGDHHDMYPFALSQASGGTMEFTNSPQVFRHFQAMSNELVVSRLLICPKDPDRKRILPNSQGRIDFQTLSNGNLSYFVGLDADEIKPERLLSGDRNITGGTPSKGFLRLLTPATKAGWTSEIHQNAGNLGLADGSVMQTDALLLRRQLRTNPLAVIRLAIP